MSEATTRLLQEILDLPDDQREELLGAVQAATGNEPRSLPFAEEWLAEIQRRSDEYDRGEAKTVSWEEVQERMNARRARHG